MAAAANDRWFYNKANADDSDLERKATCEGKTSAGPIRLAIPMTSVNARGDEGPTVSHRL